MQIVYAQETPPKSFTRAIFLAGPTPRSADTQSWRPEAVRLLQESGYDSIVFVPEPRNGKWETERSNEAWRDAAGFKS